MKLYEIENIANINYGTRVVKKRDSGTIYDVYGGGGKTFKVDSFNRENCVIISRFGMSEECVRRVDGKFFLNDSGLSVETKDPNVVIQKYIDWFLFSKMFDIYLLGRGAAQKNLDVDKFRLIKIPVPSLKEQEKIVERLDKVFEIIDKSANISENKIKNIQMIYSSSLNKKIEKDLSKEFLLGDLCEVITKGTTPTSVGHKFTESGINFIKIECINSNGEFLQNNFSYISEECHKTLKRSQLAEGDILFSITGALGRTALVTNDILPANTNQNLAIIRLKKNVEINLDYLIYILNSNLVENQSNKFMAGVAQQALSLTQLKNYKINLPNIKIQNETVIKIDLIKNKRIDLEDLYLKKLIKLKLLKKSILFEAFSKLITEDVA